MLRVWTVWDLGFMSSRGFGAQGLGLTRVVLGGL